MGVGDVRQAARLSPLRNYEKPRQASRLSYLFRGDSGNAAQEAVSKRPGSLGRLPSHKVAREL